MHSTDSPPFTLRAVGAADYQWLWELKRLTMREYVEQTWGSWDDAAQERFFRQNYSAHTVQIIAVDGRDAGLLNVEREADEIFLANIQIHPSFQNLGLGTAVVRTLFASADALRLPVRLQVLKTNTRARALYLRLGFTIYGDTITHFLLRREPS